MVELAAIYAHVPKKLNNDGPSKKKESWVKKLEVALRTAMTEDKAGRLTGAKARSPAYKGVDPPFASRETMFERGSVVVGDTTGKRDSWKNIKGDSQKIKVMLASTLAGASGPSVAAEEARRERNLTIESSSLSGTEKQSMKDKLSIQFAQRRNISGKFQGPASDMGGGVVNPVLARALAKEGGQQQGSRFGSGGSGKLDRSKLSSIEALFQKQAPPKRLGPADSSPSAAASAAAPLDDTTPTILRPSRGSVFDHAEIHPTPNLPSVPSGQARSASYGSAVAGDGDGGGDVDGFGAFGGQHEAITDFVPNPIRSTKFSAAPPAAAAADSTSAGSKMARPNVSSALEALFDKRKATADQQDNKDL